MIVPQQTYPISDPNSHIREYLTRYIKPENKYDFAVLLTGPWGVGKTYLVKDILHHLQQSQEFKYLYVSLYGVTRLSQIEDEFARQLHPILSHKATKLLGRVVLGALKGALKIDITKDESAELNASIPTIDLSEFLANSKGHLLIFDDLERSSMRTEDVLGYINSFVEQDGMKCVIIANEKEIIRRNTKEKETSTLTIEYSLIKEKLIGQTLEVHSNIGSALPSMIDTVGFVDAKKYLYDCRDRVLELFLSSETKNFRLLKQALWDFEKVAEALKERHWKKEDGLSDLLSLVLALSFEVRSGAVSSEDLEGLAENEISAAYRKRHGATETAIDRVRIKYPDTYIEPTMLSVQVLRSLLFEGRVDNAALLKDLDHSRSFALPGVEPTWRVAWSGFDRTDAEYESAIALLESEFRNRHYEKIGVVLHIFGIRLQASRIGSLKIARPVIVEECKSYVDDLYDHSRLPDYSFGTVQKFEVDTGFDGAGYAEVESDEFKDLKRYLFDRMDEFVESLYPQRGNELISMVHKDVEGFYRKLVSNNGESAVFADIPILSHVPAINFAHLVISLPSKTQRIIFMALGERYKGNKLEDSLRDEREWLLAFRGALLDKAPDLHPMTRERILTSIARSISPNLADA